MCVQSQGVVHKVVKCLNVLNNVRYPDTSTS